MICVKRLVAHSEPNNYTLMEDNNYPKDNTNLAQIIPAFFCKSAPSAHIAVVCGECERWSAEQLKEVVRANHNHIQVDTFCLETPPESTTNSTIYCSLAVANSLEEAWSHVAQMLGIISERLDRVRDPNRTHVIQALLKFNLLAELCQDLLFPYAFSERHVKEITEVLRALQQSNDLPPIIILVYLPSEAFDCFETPGYCFPKQLEYVVKVEDYNELIRDLWEKLTDERLLNTKKEAVIDKLCRRIEYLEKQNRQLRQYADRAETPDKCTPDYALEADSLAEDGSLGKIDANASERTNPPEEADQIIYVNVETDTTKKSSPSHPASIPHTDNYLHKNEYANPLAAGKDDSAEKNVTAPESKTPTRCDVFLHQNGGIFVSQIEREKEPR